MALAAGMRLGPYEVLSPLGAGGMGEVYRARDTRLGRDVAVKVLPDDLASDPKALARFESEARAVAALSHPNILALHDVGEASGVRYAVLELLQGETLRPVVTRGALPVRRALEVAEQVARGLAAAHDKGVVHRDLKPENVFLTKDGHAKVLDFGLAVLRGGVAALGSDTRSPTAPVLTETGAVVGTVAYMSPEQARGEAVDFRTDQFSLGILLYEMLAGSRPFGGVSAVDLLASIVRDEPEPLQKRAPYVPAPLRWVVERCLSKDPDARYAATRDLAHDLASLRARLPDLVTAVEPPGATTSSPPDRSRSRRTRLAPVALALWAAATTFLAVRAWLTSPAAPVLSYRRVTFRRGAIQSARFAPDGQTVVYSALLEGRPAEVFTTRADNPVSRPVGLPSAELLAVSRSAELLVLLGSGQTSLFVPSGTLARVPIEGGAPRPLLEGVSEADWAPDGQSFAVIREVEGEKRLEYPPGTVLERGDVAMPRVSPDGDRVVYMRGSEGGLTSLVVADRAGGKTVLSTPFPLPFGPVWDPGGKEVWFTADEPGKTQAAPLCAVDLAGRLRVVTRVPKDLIVRDVAPGGRLLVEHQLKWATIRCQPPGQTRERDLGWLDHSRLSSLSSDGRTVVFTEHGDGERWKPAVYLRGTDRSPAVRLGDGWAGELSPDGKWVFAQTEAGFALLPTGTGEPRPVAPKGIELRGFHRWFPDGKRLLVVGSEPGKERRFFVLPLDGGDPRPVAPVGAPGPAAAAVAPDGTRFATPGGDGRISLHPVEGGTPRPLPGAEPGEVPFVFSPDGRWLYVGPRPGRSPSLRISRIEVASGRREPWRELSPVDATGAGVIASAAVAPDGSAYAYSWWGQLFSDLYVVEGLR